MFLKDINFFYGWWVVAALFLIAAYSTGIVNWSFTALIEPITKEFGWSYAQVSFAASIRGMEVGILAPLLGLLIDRLGPRKPLFVGIILLGVGLLVLSRIETLAMFYGIFSHSSRYDHVCRSSPYDSCWQLVS
jgi:predicted MFS family arabinose efflux permease